MSRTDKDRPYWVRVNDEASLTHHDHTAFGRTYYRSVPVRDADGNPVYEDVPYRISARTIVEEGLVNYMISRHFRIPEQFPSPESLSSSRRENIIREAIQYHGWGLGYHQIIVGTRKVVKYERKEYTTLSYCTEGVPLAGPYDTYYSRNQRPCRPYLPYEGKREYYTSNMSRAKAAISKKRNGHSRAEARNTLAQVAQRWNSGDDIEDYDNEKFLTAQHRHSMAWDLY
ncbi:MAG: hypothetical protein ACRC5T_03325 [Cetobacterium sp.]